MHIINIEAFCFSMKSHLLTYKNQFIISRFYFDCNTFFQKTENKKSFFVNKKRIKTEASNHRKSPKTMSPPAFWKKQTAFSRADFGHEIGKPKRNLHADVRLPRLRTDAGLMKGCLLLFRSFSFKQRKRTSFSLIHKGKRALPSADRGKEEDFANFFGKVHLSPLTNGKKCDILHNT